MKPFWAGENLRGPLLLRAAVGPVDVFRLARFISPAARRAGHGVWAECDESLCRLLRQVDGVVGACSCGGATPDCDAEIDIRDLPDIADLTPSSVPYLAPPPREKQRWKHLFPSEMPIRIGLALENSPIAASALAPFSSRRDLRWYALAWPAELPPNLRAIDCRSNLADYADVAAVMVQLDLIISTGGWHSHLAGALGLPVWLLQADTEEFREYPTVRRFEPPFGLPSLPKSSEPSKGGSRAAAAG